MILERVEKDELVKAIYESSNVLASTYNKNNKNLNVVFKNGGSYTYQNVSQTDYLRFETADSQGNVLNTQIKKYAFLKHENVDVEEVTKKIKQLKADEIKSLEAGLFNLMTEANKEYETIGSFNDKTVERLNNMLNLYNQSK